MVSYKIIRFYKDINKKDKGIMKGLSLEEAQAHCRRFDGYEQE